MRSDQIVWLLLTGVAAAVLMGAGVFFLVSFVRAAREDPPTIETHWGGFGGGLGGIRFSATLVYLLLALVLCGAATMILSHPPWDLASRSDGATASPPPTTVPRK